MPTPSTRTPVRIARGSYSNLNSSISDLQDGEISYAEDQNKLYVKEGSSLVPLTFSPASPAFTGTITGVNLTLSGDLTVNGTTTTINTQTLDVEDKNIVIGKVASPSDTTADGGGITLKGSSDHTFNWINATDAWTSSEHLVLAAGKRLLIGTTTEGETTANDLTIANGSNCGITIRSGSSNNGSIYFADGTSGTAEYEGMVEYNNVINALKLYSNHALALTLDSSQNATFAGNIQVQHIRNDGIYLKNAAGTENFIDCSPNAEVSLFYDNTKRAETTNTGFLVTGTVSDTKGDLRKIPRTNKTSSYTLTSSDGGKCITASTGTSAITVPTSTMAEGDAVTIYNNTNGNIAITQGSSFTLNNAADGTTGNRVLAAKGIATIWFVGTGDGVISGAGLS